MATSKTSGAAPDFDPTAPGGIDTYDPELTNPMDAEGSVDEWNGKSTQVTVMFPINRHHRILSRGENFVVSSSRDRDGRWHGPEAEHVTDLIRGGYLKSPEAEDRMAEIQTVNAMRGVSKTKLPELLQPTSAADMRRRSSTRGLEGDPKELLRMERGERHSGVEELAQAMVAYAGAQGAGTASNRDGTRLVQE